LSSFQDGRCQSYEDLYNVERARIAPCNLFKPQEGEDKIPRKILVLGRAGIGKSTFVKYLAWQWSEGAEWLDHFEWVFVIPLRDMLPLFSHEEDINLIDVFKYLYKEPLRDCRKEWRAIEEELEDFCDSLLASESVLWVLDGWDEIASYQDDERINYLFKKWFKSDKTRILVTTRPYSRPTLVENNELRVVEVMGFNDAHIQLYINQYYQNLKYYYAHLRGY